MKTILLVTAAVAVLGFAACESSHSHVDRTDRAPVVGPTTGIKSQSTHAGNSEGSRTDLR